jgi:2-hydroxychromene-2-carboxylate isomerase
MGEVISLAGRRERRRLGELARSGRPRATFFFDLTSPYTYLAAERVDRLFPGVEWRPAFLDAVCAGDPLTESGVRERLVAAAHARAEELGMPLVWPDRYPAAGRAAMRVASLAAEEGRAAPFVLAASRLAFCGGFDLDDPETLAEAAAAACLGLDACLAAAGERNRDGQMERCGLKLLAQGADQVPALQVGRVLFSGEHRIAEAAAAWRASFADVHPETAI